MISELPKIQVPSALTRICKIQLKNSRIAYGNISDILENDKFLNQYVQENFADYLKKGGVLGMLTAMGWQGFRNRLAEVYLFHARYKRYPTRTELDEVHDVVDIERRFDFLHVEGNSRVFLLGFYLKLCDIYLEVNDEFIGKEFITTPPELDELLIKGKSKSEMPDWLIITVWSFINILGAEEATELMLTSKGKIGRILHHITDDQHDQLIANLLKYGHGINDKSFFLMEKV